MQDHPAPGHKLPVSLPSIYEDFITVNHTRVHWQPGEIAYDLGDSFEYTWLVLSRLISLLRPVDDGRTVEATSVGPGGMIGYLGGERGSSSLFRAEVQVVTEALRADAEMVHTTFQKNEAFHNLVRGYRQSLEDQIAQALGCRSYHRTESRLAGWLLCAQSHLLSDHLDFTHLDLAAILGVSRSVVTSAVRRLERFGLIDTSRKHIYILNRRRLRSTSCECFKSIVRKFFFGSDHSLREIYHFSRDQTVIVPKVGSDHGRIQP